MTQPDFYKILGVRPGANADEIKSAYRKLVKKYHPDLFSTANAKKKANEKLQQINEAYAVLGDEERRRQYDATRVRKRAISQEPATSTPHRTSNAQNKTAASVDKVVFFKPAAWVLGVVLVVIVADAVWSMLQEEKSAWILWSRTVVEPSQSISGRDPGGLGWLNLGRHGTRLQCAGTLRELVARDEREGRKTIIDEAGGTIAITIHIKSEETLTQEFFQEKLKQRPGRAPADPWPVHEQELLKQQAREEAKEFVRKNGVAKRETTYACREITLPKRESFLHRTLKTVELLS